MTSNSEAAATNQAGVQAKTLEGDTCSKTFEPQPQAEENLHAQLERRA